MTRNEEKMTKRIERRQAKVIIDLALEAVAGLRIFERKCATELGMMERVLEHWHLKGIFMLVQLQQVTFLL